MSNFFILTSLIAKCILLSFWACGIHDKEAHSVDTLNEDAQKVDTIQPNLDNAISETSALLRIDGKLWTLGDSGFEPALFHIDPHTGEILDKRIVPGANNVDWESLAADEEFIYIGDFGNNRGARRNLGIYKIPLEFLKASKESIGQMQAEFIGFSYPEQTVFPNNYGHNFDGEALISYQDSLYLFTKNHQNLRSSIYAIPKASGIHQARLISSLDTKGTITAATKSLDNQTVILAGYEYLHPSGFKPFVWILEDFSAPDFFSGSQKRVDLSLDRQIEAIAYNGSSQVYLTAERSRRQKASLFSLDIDSN